MPVTWKAVCVTIHIEGDYWLPHFVPWTDTITYVIGQLEISQEGNQHWQLYLESSEKGGLAKWKHWMMNNSAHIEGRNGTREQAIQYCQKTESRIHGPETDFLLDTGIRSTSRDQNSPYKKALEATTLDDAMSVIKEYCPRDYVIYNNAISSTMRRLFTKEPVFQTGLHFNICSLDDDTMKSKSIVITGTSGIGKTQYALSQFTRPLLISHIDDLKNLRPHHNGLVFDDMSFQHWPPQSCIHLLDLELPRSINVKYGTVTIPSLLPRIFTSNKTLREIFSLQCQEVEWSAIERRCYLLEVHTKLY